MHGEDLVQSFSEILQQLKTVRDLGGFGCPLVRAISIGFRPITGDDLHPQMFPEPLGQRLGGAIREERDRLAALQIDQHRAIGLAFPHREIVHTEHGGSCQRRNRQPAEHA